MRFRFGATTAQTETPNKASEKSSPTASPPTAATGDALKRPIPLNTSEKLMERAKRFGLPVVRDER